MKLVSWNVNGLRAIWKKNDFTSFLKSERPDVLGVQETKMQEDQATGEMRACEGYKTYWHSAEKKGYSSVALYCKKEPVAVTKGIGLPEFDREGRVITSDHGDFLFLNIYFPNGERSQERLDYKMKFYDAVLSHCQKLRKKGRKLIVAGDYNTAHREIDLARPKENSDKSGFLPMERAWLDKWISHGYVDVFRKFYPDAADQYTWWHYRTFARERNVGWRIDYHFVTEDLVDRVKDCKILSDVMGSDHCPVLLTLK